MNIPIISVTGTKGKTTTTAVIADVLQKMGKDVLKVDTTGHYVNGQQKSTLEDSKKTWRLVPTVCPGRFLWEFHSNPSLAKNGVAVLECALGSSAAAGLGYRNHNVGVFLNVFEDHLGSSTRLKTKQDIAKAKEFIFKKLDRDNSYAVFNADDPLVCQALNKAPAKTVLIPCGISFSYFDIDTHLRNGGLAVTAKSHKAVLLGAKERVLFDLKSIPWTFEASFEPSVLNLLHAAGAVIAQNGGVVSPNFKNIFEAVRLDHYGGRLTLLKAANGATILADYAHEKVSMVEVANLARKLTGNTGEVIGVVRLAKDRTDKLIQETGEEIARHYDRLIVFDKIDGYWKKPKITTGRFPETVGRVSKLLAESIQSQNPNVERIIREDKAIARASEIAKPEDVIVVIVNDDIKRSVNFIIKSFRAEFF